MRARASLAGVGLLLAGCEDGAPERNVTQVAVANPHSDQLKALSEPSRFLGLYRALRDNGQRCKRVDRGAYQQQYKTMAMWTARCTDSGDWAVYIAPNGDVQASPCAHAKELGLPECAVQAGEASEKR
ncbi:MAG TPA: hypothetical protein VEA60_13515 [Allosphingosinicella sp.]|nr:hypothetical protein [Allosphingosinicella sp.]